MNKTYKLQYTIQNQLLEGGKIQKHKRFHTTIPSFAVADMGLDDENNLININYDENTKTITITKV